MLYDALILGTGTMGVAAALSLARRGKVVLALDKQSIPNTLSEHFGSARMFRTAYYEDPVYVPLLRKSRELWLALNLEAGESLYHETGGLYLGPGSAAGGEVVPRSAEAARVHGIAHETLTAANIAARFPQFRLRPGMEGWEGLYEPAAGVIRPEAAMRAMARLARDAGATLGTHEEVLEILPSDAEVEVVTDRSRYHAKTLIVTSGAWAQKVLTASGLASPRITVTRQAIGWFKPGPKAECFRLGAGGAGPPCWAVEDEPGSLLYGFPVLPGEDSFRVARHRRGATTDPDTMDRAVTAEDRTDFEPAVRSLLPDAGEVSRAAVAFYSNSDDSHFVIDRVPGCAHVVLAAGFSGHGFKFAPVVGEVLADLAMGVVPPFDLGLFGLGRFK